MRIAIVLVLYKRSAEESESLVTLRQILNTVPEIGSELSLLVYDNSPTSHEVPALPIPLRYVSDPSNSGLASAYNEGLRMAAVNGASWLMLLDHDTVLTREYLSELRDLAGSVPEGVWVVVPKLVHTGGIHSPHYLPRLSHHAVAANFSGVATQDVSAFNSGALVRVNALQLLGGFPMSFRIEYLDHAMFHMLQSAGGKVWVMRATLAHDLSAMRLGETTSMARYRQILIAERNFYSGMKFTNRAWYRSRRLKQACGHLLKVKNKQFAWWDLRAAFGALGDDKNT